jgi:hypothetical protein
MKRHRFDPVSFIWGVFFAALGVVFAADVVEPTVAGLRSFWPLAGVALGLAILSTIRREPREAAGPAAPGPAPRAVQSPTSPFFTDEGAHTDPVAPASPDDEHGNDDDTRPLA